MGGARFNGPILPTDEGKDGRVSIELLLSKPPPPRINTYRILNNKKIKHARGDKRLRNHSFGRPTVRFTNKPPEI